MVTETEQQFEKWYTEWNGFAKGGLARSEFSNRRYEWDDTESMYRGWIGHAAFAKRDSELNPKKL